MNKKQLISLIVAISVIVLIKLSSIYFQFDCFINVIYGIGVIYLLYKIITTLISFIKGNKQDVYPTMIIYILICSTLYFSFKM
ncbi:TPA: hypothetical protein ACF0PM_002157 [Clostridium perfringens]|uniref:hypothetical protein n=1 Tax=Clostridium perfringens TaxID=1502 RepID=UPI000B37144A|nr:hypothetical protein [Clostridium perfringens]OUN49598.1 hypothetical protein B5G18_14700 [Clostridium perfringens]OUP46261.1 hypothetical protein B5F20_09835 [Clostridium perfringens]